MFAVKLEKLERSCNQVICMAKKTRNEARLKRHKRVRKYVYGTVERPRLNVYRSLQEIYAQVVDDDLGHTIASASSIDQNLRSDLKELDKIEQARMVGKIVAERAQEQGVKQVVFDRGGYKYIGRIKALAEGARKAGLEF